MKRTGGEEGKRRGGKEWCEGVEECKGCGEGGSGRREGSGGHGRGEGGCRV